MMRMAWLYAQLAAYVVVIFWDAICSQPRSKVRARERKTTLLFCVVQGIVVLGSPIEHHAFPLHGFILSISLLGTALFTFRVFLKRWAMGVLGDMYSIHAGIAEGHKLHRDGPYRFLRHPAYLAHFLGCIGITLIFNAWLTLVTAAVLDLVTVSIRVRKEEAALEKKFQEAYLRYRKEVPAFFPVLFSKSLRFRKGAREGR